MPGPRNQPALINNHLNSCKMVKEKKPIMLLDSKRTESKTRKIRFTYSDPYATESDSSDDESHPKLLKPKRFVREISLPMVVFPHPGGDTDLEPESSSQDSNNGAKPPKKKRRVLAETLSPVKPTKRTGPRRPVGVRLRKWGKFAVEIRNPLTKTRTWLGTFDTEQEAVQARDAKRREFDAMFAAASEKSQNDMKFGAPASSSRADTKSELSHTSPSSVPELDTSVVSNTYAGSVDLIKGEKLEDSKPVLVSDSLKEESFGLEANEADAAVSVPINAEGFDANAAIADLEIPDLGFLSEPLLGLDIRDFDLEQLDFEDGINEFGMLFDDYCGIEDLVIGGFEDSGGPSELPDFDFDLASDAFALLEDRHHQQQPLNIACL